MEPERATASLEKLLLEERARYEKGLLSKNTVTGYRYDWAMFRRWTVEMGRESLPASTETMALYITHLLTLGRKITTIRRRVSAVIHYHHDAEFPSPVTETIFRLLKGAQRIRREKVRQMKPLMLPELRAIARLLTRDDTTLSIRNRAILTLAFASALRRDSLCALDLDDVEFCRQGIILKIRKEKQDQEGKGREIGIPWGKRSATCPVQSLKAWLRRRGQYPGALFTHVPDDGRRLRGETICRMVKRAVSRIGLNPDEYGAHSTRAGFITEAGEAGIGELLIAYQTGHRSMDILRRYFRRSQLFRNNPLGKLDL